MIAIRNKSVIVESRAKLFGQLNEPERLYEIIF